MRSLQNQEHTEENIAMTALYDENSSPNDDRTYQLCLMAIQESHLEPMSKYAIAALRSLRPELKKKLKVKPFITFLEQVYMTPETKNFRQTELQIINYLTSLLPHLDTTEEMTFQ